MGAVGSLQPRHPPGDALMAEQRVAPKGCVCADHGWYPDGNSPGKPIPQICTKYYPIADNEDWCVCGHDKECHEQPD